MPMWVWRNSKQCSRVAVCRLGSTRTWRWQYIHLYSRGCVNVYLHSTFTMWDELSAFVVHSADLIQLTFTLLADAGLCASHSIT